MRSRLFDALKGFRNEFPNARVLQIGANDGVVNDPLREHILVSNWRCLLVEPVPYLYARLQQNYRKLDRVECLNVAVSDSPDEADFFFIREDVLPQLPDWASQIGSFSLDHIRKHFRCLDENWISKKRLRIISIQDLMSREMSSGFDFVHLDVEGHEARLIKGILEAGKTPKVILFESHHLGEEKIEVEGLLAQHGYQFQAHGMDTLAMR